MCKFYIISRPGMRQAGWSGEAEAEQRRGRLVVEDAGEVGGVFAELFGVDDQEVVAGIVALEHAGEFGHLVGVRYGVLAGGDDH